MIGVGKWLTPLLEAWLDEDTFATWDTPRGAWNTCRAWDNMMPGADQTLYRLARADAGTSPPMRRPHRMHRPYVYAPPPLPLPLPVAHPPRPPPALQVALAGLSDDDLAVLRAGVDQQYYGTVVDTLRQEYHVQLRRVLDQINHELRHAAGAIAGRHLDDPTPWLNTTEGTQARRFHDMVRGAGYRALVRELWLVWEADERLALHIIDRRMGHIADNIARIIHAREAGTTPVLEF